MFNNTSNQPAPILSPLPTSSQSPITPTPPNRRKLFIIISIIALIVVASIITVIIVVSSQETPQTHSAAANASASDNSMVCTQNSNSVILTYDQDDNITSYESNTPGLPSSTAEVEQLLQDFDLGITLDSIEDQFYNATGEFCTRSTYNPYSNDSDAS